MRPCRAGSGFGSVACSVQFVFATDAGQRTMAAIALRGFGFVKARVAPLRRVLPFERDAGGKPNRSDRRGSR